MVEKKNSFYVNGLIIAVIIVVGLLLINFFVDQSRIYKLNNEFISYSWDMEESKLFLLYLDFIEEKEMTCPILKQRLGQLSSRNAAFLEDLEKYENVNVFSTQYHNLKKTFSLRNMEFFFYYSSYREKCNDKANYILYFYPNSRECSDCKIQASILDNVRDMCSNVIIFAFPSDTDSDIINLLKFKYNIISEPSIVINGKDTPPGIVSKAEILSKITCTKEKVVSPEQ